MILSVDMWALGCTMHSLLTHTLQSINIEVYSNPNLRSDLQAELAEHGMLICLLVARLVSVCMCECYPRAPPWS